jgi:hypothetical protein
LAGEDPEYLAFVREQSCLNAGHGSCWGSMHAHHPQGGKGMGTRNHDHRAVPLCTKHHTERHALSGAWKGFDKRRIREVEAAAAEALRRQYLGLGSDAPVDF